MTNRLGFELSHFFFDHPPHVRLVDCAYFVKSTPPTAFIGTSKHFVYIMDTSKTCIKKFDVGKVNFSSSEPKAPGELIA